MLEALVFYVLAAVMVGSALAVLLSRNIVRAAVWLFATLASVAGLYLLLSATFLAALQLILYAGGILILLVFGIMLTTRNPRGLQLPPVNEIAAAVGVGGVLMVGMLVALVRPWPPLPAATPTAEIPAMESIGRALLTSYLLPFEVVSVLLLAVLIGAAYLARPERP